MSDRPTRRPARPGVLRYSSEIEVRRFAEGLEETAPEDYFVGPVVMNPGTGGYGQLIELIFGLDINNRPGPDFDFAGIELKATRLEKIRSRWEVGERTSLHMIDYRRLPAESWEQATLRPKLAKLLFCFYRRVAGEDPLTWVIDKVHFWHPDNQQWEYLRSDWEYIRKRCALGQAHLLSERDCLVLGAATKAANSSVLRQQVDGPPAKPRVFALKKPFVRTIYDVACGRVATESLIKRLQIRDVTKFESTLVRKLHTFAGRRIGRLATETGTPLSSAKQYSSIVVGRVVRRLLGIEDPRARIREFEELGIEMHVVPVRPNGTVKEALSFPGFKYRALLEEEWESSDLRSRLNRLLMIPIHRPDRDAALADWTLGRAFFWSPSDAELAIIKAEWEMYRREIRQGQAGRLTTAAHTRFIHVRPKARNKLDTDDAPGGPVVKKCFWLNQTLLTELVAKKMAK